MPYTEPTSLAIVACPGGEAFANEVITHLKHMYKHRFTLKNDVLSKRYELSKEELVNRINLQNDLQTSDLCIRGATDKYISNMDSVIQSVEKDNASYSQPDEYSKLVAVRDRNYDELAPLEELESPDSDAEESSASSGNAGRDLDDDIL